MPPGDDDADTAPTKVDNEHGQKRQDKIFETYSPISNLSSSLELHIQNLFLFIHSTLFPMCERREDMSKSFT